LHKNSTEKLRISAAPLNIIISNQETILKQCTGKLQSWKKIKRANYEKAALILMQK
jgi:hypothetical protein